MPTFCVPKAAFAQGFDNLAGPIALVHKTAFAVGLVHWTFRMTSHVFASVLLYYHTSTTVYSAGLTAALQVPRGSLAIFFVVSVLLAGGT